MGFQFFFSLIILCSVTSVSTISDQTIKSLDLLIRDYTFKSYDINFRTGKLHSVRLPANFSGIRADTARFRCGSLRRYGAQVKEFHLGIGVTIQPCVERVMVIRQNLGHNWSSIFFSNYNFSGYQLVSPILGLLAYNGGSDVNFTNPFELEIHALQKQITINFTNLTTNLQNQSPICASFENNGKVTLKNPDSLHVCVATRHGHYGLVIKSPPLFPPPGEVNKKISRWKVIVGGTIGSALAVMLLGFLLVAMFVKVKKKARIEEMERRAYEEEALQVSMVGHVRAPTATVTRTLPSIEHEYKSYYRPS
ncbi:uncharacterized protein LOC126678122 [Mercurialis annua]|uniref:uncharacterized protein LOC126678122 n=1 Tax=Mercurialis annua TaxID=3986 RepID=UPI00215EAF41|nr:uncharacterized protein LOC126678122 [Mercurialis annua]